MSALRVGALLATVLATVSVSLVAPSASQAVTTPAPPYNIITMESPTANAWFSGSRIYDAPADTIAAHKDGLGGLELTANNTTFSQIDVSATVDPPTGSSLAVGQYSTLNQADATHVGLSLFTESECPLDTSGSINIQELTLDGTGNPTSFSATYSLLCDGGTISGELRFNAQTTYAVASVNDVDFGIVDETIPTAAHTVTVTAVGPTPTQITGPATLTGAGASQFSILSDGCNGATLSAGQTCAVSVRGDSMLLGDVGAYLQVPDNSTAGQVTAGLHLDGKQPAKGTLEALTPRRLLDTRIGLGATKGALAGGGTIHLKVTGGAVPTSGVEAVVLNLTETGATTNGYVTAFPSGTTRPTASNINYVPGITRANFATVQVGAGGKIDLYNCCGHVNLIADITGYYLDSGDPSTENTGSVLLLAQPQRILDTRTWSPAGLKSGFEEDMSLDFGPTANAGMTAALVTITAVKPTAGGYVTAFNPQEDPAATSTLNLHPGVTTPNLAIVPTTPCNATWCNGLPIFSVFNGSPKTTNILVDLLGVFTSPGQQYALRYRPVAPTRIVDTRSSLGAPPLGAQSTTVIQTPDSIGDYWTGALSTNVTAIKPTASTYLTLWPYFTSNDAKPTISSSNPAPGVTVANSTVTEAGANNAFNIYNNAGTTNVAIDIAGTFEYLPSDFPPLAPMVRGSAVGRAPLLSSDSGGHSPSGGHRPATG